MKEQQKVEEMDCEAQSKAPAGQSVNDENERLQVECDEWTENLTLELRKKSSQALSSA